MIEALTGYLEVIEDAGTLAQLGFGLFSSIIATYFF